MERKRKDIRLTNSIERPLTEPEITAATVAYANGANLVLEDQGFGPTREPADWQALALHREKIRRQLRLAITNPGAAAAEILRRDGYHYRNSTKLGGDNEPELRRVARRTSEGLEIHLFQRFTDDSLGDGAAVADTGLLLFLDVAKEWRAKLCVCKLESCGRFFFKKQPKRGAPRTEYCSQTHMQAAHNRAGAKRMRKVRESRRSAHK